MEYHEKFVIDHWDKLNLICRSRASRYLKSKAIYGDAESLAEEMFCEAIIARSKQCFESFDASKNDNLEAFMFGRFKLYCLEWITRKRYGLTAEREQTFQSIDDVIANNHNDPALSYADENSALSARDEAMAIIGVLSDFDRRLLILKIVKEWTFDQIAEALSCPESSVRMKYNAALLKAQWYGKQRTKRGIV